MVQCFLVHVLLLVQSGQVLAVPGEIHNYHEDVKKVLDQNTRLNNKESTKKRRDSNIERHSIPSTDLDLEKEPFAKGGSCLVYRAEFSGQTVCAKECLDPRL